MPLISLPRLLSLQAPPLCSHLRVFVFCRALSPDTTQPLLPPPPLWSWYKCLLKEESCRHPTESRTMASHPPRPPGRPDLLTIRFFHCTYHPWCASVLDIYLFATSVSSHTQVLLHEVRNSAFFTAASPGTITAPGINEHAMSTCWADVNELLWNWRQRAPSTQRWVSQNSPAFVPAPLG